MRTTVYAIPAMLIVTALLGAGGCRSARVTAPQTEADRLRAELLDLRDELEAARLRNRELQAQLREAVSRAEALRAVSVEVDSGAAAEVAEATPRVVDVQIGRLSHARDTDDDGQADQLTLYVRPVDGRGRFVQAVGDLEATAVLLADGGQPVVIGRVDLGAAALRGAYRSGFTGTHYTVEIPLRWPTGVEVSAMREPSAVVRLSLRDSLTGQTHVVEQIMPLDDPRR